MNDVLKQALEALTASNSQPLPWWVSERNQESITSLRQAIRELENQKPAAWRWKTHNGYAYSEQHYEGEDGQPLYTHPPQRKPLTDEQIAETFCKAPHQTQHVAWFAAGVRYAEAVHGIKE